MIKEYRGWTAEKLDLFEDDIRDAFIRGEIRHPIHLSKGNSQQVLDVFSKYNIGDSDWVFSNHRSHFHALLKGIPKEWLKQQIITGHSMHLMSKEYKFFASSIVGGSIPIAVGVALSLKRKPEKGHVWAFCGDMASLSGIFYECEQYASNFNLPISFVIENNNMSTNSPTDSTWGILHTPFKEIKTWHQWINGKTLIYCYTRECEHINVGTHVIFS